MIVERLECRNFRNYAEAQVSFDSGINVLVGDNAQGKTNLIEAIRLCGTTRSHRGAKDAEMIRFGGDEAHLRLHIRGGHGARRVDMHLRRGGAKGIAIDGVPIRRASELMGTLYTVLFSPEDLSIIKRGPRERRRFLDAELCQLSGAYFAELAAYNRVVLQRNALLKELPGRADLVATLDSWDEQLLAHGLPVLRARRAFLEDLKGIVADRHAQITGGAEELRILYEPETDEEHFAEAIANNRDRDRHLRTTTTGPHRDDLRVEANGIDLRRFGSQGQQRTAALSLKLAEIELVRQRAGETPVLLLDDVLSELDAGRQAQLLESIGEIQTFLTCTGTEEMADHRFPIDRSFRVQGGTITEENT